MLRRWVLLVLTAATLIAASPSVAHARGDDVKEKRAKVEQRVKQLRTRVLRQEVGLDATKAEAVEKLLVSHEGERRKLQRAQREHRRELRELLQHDSSDDAAFKKHVDAFRVNQKKLAALNEREMDEIAKLITPKQQAKLFAAIQRLRRRMAARPAGKD